MKDRKVFARAALIAAALVCGVTAGGRVPLLPV
jgi:hypothetical protein